MCLLKSTVGLGAWLLKRTARVVSWLFFDTYFTFSFSITVIPRPEAQINTRQQ